MYNDAAETPITAESFVKMLVSDLVPTVDDAGTPVGRAELISRLFQELPIGFAPGSLMAGDFGPDYLPPSERKAAARKCRDQLRARAPAPVSREPADEATLMGERFGIHAGVTIGHACVDYAMVIDRGVEGIIADIRKAVPDAADEEREYRQAMIRCFEGFLALAERYAALAERCAEAASCASESNRLREMARVCRRVPRRPATTFREAVQSFWLTHAAVMLSELITWDSMSPGRMDQYLWPCFCSDRDRGVPDQLQEAALDDLWAKFDRYCECNHNVNLGGMDAAGDDAFNDLSAMILRVAKKKPSNVPLLSVRIHPGMRSEDFRLAADPLLMKTGQPTFYGEEACRNALRKRGVAAEDLPRFAAGSCMALAVQGREYSGMWDLVVNVWTPLELAINGGRGFAENFPLALETPPKDKYRNIDELVAQWAAYLAEIVAWCVKRSEAETKGFGRACLNPFLSALIGAIDSGRDRADYGAHYHCSNCNAFGLVNAADALTAIDRLVFVERRFSLGDLVTAAKADFEGWAHVHRAIMECPKFGNADEEADAMAGRLSELYAAAVTAHDKRNIHYLPSFHTLHGHIGTGGLCPASLDGRRAGEPLAKNMGTVPARTREGVTALMLSATRVDQSAFSGGQALDITIDGSILDTPDGVSRFRALLETYFSRGGLQAQVNTVSAETLRAAMECPDQHPDLIVRVAGYSARFTSLAEDLQRDLLIRFE